ncbi:unnamed protein product [Pylaiella littoralis]
MRPAQESFKLWMPAISFRRLTRLLTAGRRRFCFRIPFLFVSCISLGNCKIARPKFVALRISKYVGGNDFPAALKRSVPQHSSSSRSVAHPCIRQDQGAAFTLDRIPTQQLLFVETAVDNVSLTRHVHRYFRFKINQKSQRPSIMQHPVRTS